MTPDLSRRIALAFALGCATPAEQTVLIDAAGPGRVRSVADLPKAARDLLELLERRGSPFPVRAPQ
ncbi:MAG TPA: hypothetical protein VFU23_03285 [Gemmatimonadales bacterium]|nr:hypothetical protein [Gemmatimonadales bacterium]